ncbi:hypothetical protein HK099_002189 [Clydaea vesicula]|uniref:Phospho-2-dehydro-3-deoxyheptonate aldolase n=1 Tax=Clydaea vesicula TaxID=447962 RepID=A0AAD5U2X3_9FUNG|nr:hypothetical protein HK099_002189 [Clydaea vesicula]KAJ3388537.1 hypothetical protein HDU92_001429 [Lobulomyces angularis]
MTQTTNTSEWNPTSWKSKSITQDVEYSDNDALNKNLTKLSSLPPLVHHLEIDKLKNQLAEVAENKRFLLQGGDCAELFEYCSQTPLENKIKVLLQMSLILVWGGRTSVVRIARMAGQYAKPRSKPTEVINGVEYNAFRGDNVNGLPLSERKPDPHKLVEAYFHSAATVNYVRSILANGFADLHHPDNWTLDSFSLQHVKSPQIRSEYQSIVDRLLDSMDFMRTIGADSPEDTTSNNPLNTVDMFMSHEGLLLDYETSLTKKVSVKVNGQTEERFYNLGAHFIWIGDRTRQLDGAHIEYFRGVQNPIGVKVGPSMEPEELIRLLDILDPNFETGKVTLITRYGATKISNYLPSHIKAVQQTRHKVVWCSDPMHGNTELAQGGYKTRRFENIAAELGKAFRIHKDCNSQLGGVHFELTGEKVTECTGGSMEMTEAELPENYQTYCDPRLNYEQSLDIAFLIAKYYETERKPVFKL